MRDDAIRRVLLQIIRLGLLRIRAAGYAGRADDCALEADHLHNIPQLLQSHQPEELHYYFVVERPGFVSRATARVDEFTPLWDELGHLLDEKD